MTPDNTLFGDVMLKRESIFSRIFGNLSAALAPSSGGGDVPSDSPVHFEQLKDESVFSRLKEQMSFAFGELRRDPAEFMRVLISPDASNPDQIKTRQAAWALTVAVPVLAIGALVLGILAYLLIFGRPVLPGGELAQNPEYDIQEINVPVDMPKADDRSGGGGGGGRKEVTPPMKGKLPTASLQDPILAPTTHPTITTPSLPVMPTIKADPRIIPPNPDPNSIGDPNGIVGPPSDGPGEGNGIGTGKGGGVGSGDGIGAGPGSGWNVGGGQPGLGGGDRDPNSRTIATKARILNSPRPNYTEQARQNKTQGNVVVRATLGADGRVKTASVVRGLPDGLNEKAIEAVYKLSFTPARNAAGNPVDSTISVSVNFTIR